MLNKLRQSYHIQKHLLLWRLGHLKALSNRQKTLYEYFHHHRIRKLQVGCGEFQLKGWLNSDLYGSQTLFPIDLTKHFPLPDESFDIIFSEHTHEHFDFKQGMSMLSEFHRILRKNGVVRITTPDLKFLIDLYSKKTKLQKAYIEWSTNMFIKDALSNSEGYVINNFVRAWGHQFIYDHKTLKEQLEKAGFINVRFYRPGKSQNKYLVGIEHHGQATGEKFNQLESMVVEAIKP